jgi:hypothetical protein
MTPTEFIDYQRDVREAQIAFPGMELGAAYQKFMLEIKRQSPRPKLSTNDPILAAAKAEIKKAFRRKCTQPDCSGEQILQGVCEGCAAGKKGFKSMWECEECLFREYSPKPFLDWYTELGNTNASTED